MKTLICAVATGAMMLASVPAFAQSAGAELSAGRGRSNQLILPGAGGGGGPAFNGGVRGGNYANQGGNFANPGGNRGWRGGDRDWRADRGWRGGDRRRHGVGVGAGLAGLAAGAVIGGAIASQTGPAYGYPAYGYPGYAQPAYGDADDYVDDYAAPAAGRSTAYCMQRFKSYDPSSGTYLGYDGLRHPCP